MDACCAQYLRVAPRHGTQSLMTHSLPCRLQHRPAKEEEADLRRKASVQSARGIGYSLSVSAPGHSKKGSL